MLRLQCIVYSLYLYKAIPSHPMKPNEITYPKHNTTQHNTIQPAYLSFHPTSILLPVRIPSLFPFLPPSHTEPLTPPSPNPNQALTPLYTRDAGGGGGGGGSSRFPYSPLRGGGVAPVSSSASSASTSSTSAAAAAAAVSKSPAAASTSRACGGGGFAGAASV